MDTYAEIARALRAISGNDGGSALFTAEVKSVEDETCTVLVGELEVPEVMLTPAEEGAEGKLVIPVVGNWQLEDVPHADDCRVETRREGYHYQTGNELD